MSRRNKKNGPPFVQLFRWVTSSAAWKALSPTERALYLELRARFNGHNNGMIGLGCREAAESINVGRDTAHRAFGRLADLGFIEPTTLGRFSTTGRKATEWLLTEVPDDRTGHKASKAFMSWRGEGAPKKKASPISSHVSPTSRTLTAERIDEITLRPTSRTVTRGTGKLASDLKDTSKSTTTGVTLNAAPLAEEAPVHAGRAHRSEQAGGNPPEASPRSTGPIHVSDALIAAMISGRRESANG